jgi:cell division cycle protein 20 (cofactor of APC complex)
MIDNNSTSNSNSPIRKKIKDNHNNNNNSNSKLSSSSSLSPCRYIPNRKSFDDVYAYHNLIDNDNNNENRLPNGTILNTSQKKRSNNNSNNNSNNPLKVLGLSQKSQRMISCFEKSPIKNNDNNNFFKISNDSSSNSNNSIDNNNNKIRNISLLPSKILDAPDIVDDYYLNLLHWGHCNILAVALASSVYLWHPSDGNIDTLVTLDDDTEAYVTSVEFSPIDNILAVGTSTNCIQIYDVSTLTKIRELQGHTNRISSLSWSGSQTFSSGSRDSLIINHDLRERRHIRSRYIGHQQEVCGLEWSPDGKTLASGGNENLLCLWDEAYTSSNSDTTGLSSSSQQHGPRLTMNDHTAAVKALAWCPWQRNVVASGGGTADRTIKLWNTQSSSSESSLIKSIDTGSQVCAIQFSDTYRELLSSHGFSNNELILWKYSSMTKLKEFRGHSSRVLHLAKSPDGETICSASADETIRFWDIFRNDSSKGGVYKDQLSKSPMGLGLNSGLNLR